MEKNVGARFAVLAVLLGFGGASVLASSEISNGAYAVAVNEFGVLTAVPRPGLRTVDGPPVFLGEGFAEWYGVAYEDVSGRVEGVGPGTAPDWAFRQPVEPVSFAASANSALAVGRLRGVEIRTALAFDGPYLVANVTIANRGPGMVRNVLYSREWSKTGSPGWTFPPDIPPPRPAPEGVCRLLWMLDDLEPGAQQSIAFSYAPPEGPRPETIDVPLSLWTHPSFPSGLVFGQTNGISFGDYDADGWTDVFACRAARLWRNLAGESWQLVATLPLLSANRYGSSFGDYNVDGLPDIATEPRSSGDNLLRLFKNLGGGPNFVDVAGNPAIVSLQPFGDSETLCWGDANGDGLLDLFVPVYPAWANNGPGNFFLLNLGPTGPGGEYRFLETSAASGLDNPPGSARPEGAQFVDVDFDGDFDLYSNGTLYRNRSGASSALFDPLPTAVSGIGFATQLDEGAMLFDYDMDGDFDLAIAYTASPGVWIWENRGDGTFFGAEAGIVQSPLIGLGLGMSAEDWDNDGDVDFTTRQVFRRNQLVETGQHLFTVATHGIPASHLTSATPAWGDWDKDGDLDSALGNWFEQGRLYQNTLYGPGTPSEDRRFVRIRIVRDAPGVPRGLETEYGATVEIRVLGDGSGLRQKRFAASGHGYLNQNEYVLHFGLPSDPFPLDPTEDLRFDVVVDFPGNPADGLWRVDEHVNPALGAVHLADVEDREITVFRSGRVLRNGCDVPANPAVPPPLRTTAGGLALAGATTPLPAPTPSPTPNRWVGLDLATLPLGPAVRVVEVLLDGRLDGEVSCGGAPFDAALWDVTDPATPALVEGASWNFETSSRNRRHYFPTDFLLLGGRRYRLVARVAERRPTSIAGPLVEGPLTVLGGLDYADAEPCSGAAAAAAPADPTRIHLAIRFRAEPETPWTDVGGGLAGTNGIPFLQGFGSLLPGTDFALSLDGALPNACTCLVIGTSMLCQSVFGGTLVPSPEFLLVGLETNGAGHLRLGGLWPPGLPPGTTAYFQFWVLDAGASQGLSASNGVAAATRP